MTPIPPKRPVAEANRLSKLLNLSLGNERFPVNVKELASAYAGQFGHDDPISHIVGEDLPGFEGALYRDEQNGRVEWALIYNSNIPVPGRIRFTIAHELGHYILHRQAAEAFECSQNDMLHWESIERKIESEADMFASTLLMPADDFRRQIGNHVMDLDVLGHCACRYGVSLTAATLKWLEFTTQRAVLIVSRDGFIQWARSSKSAAISGAVFRTRNRVVELPAESLAACEKVITPERQGIELSARVWFSTEPQGMPVREMKIVSDRYDQTLSLLILPDAVQGRWDDRDEEPPTFLDDRIQGGLFPNKR